MDPLKNYSSDKAEEVFKTFPYTIASDKDYLRFLEYRKKFHRKNTLAKASAIFIKIAAVLFLPLALYTLYNHYVTVPKILDNERKSLVAEIPQQQQACLEYVTYSGIQGKVILPDSSEVWLNSCSRLKVPAQFDSVARYAELDGEAYFKVKSNKKWPMFVKTAGVTTKVLGTEFNLSAYNDDSAVKLTLVNGKVEMVKSDMSTIEMRPHEQITIFNDPSRKDIKKRDINDFESELAWREGYLVFNNTPMTDVMKKMERWYGVSFSPVSRQILKYNFTGRFKEESVTRVLDLLSISSNIKYKLENNIVTLF